MLKILYLVLEVLVVILPALLAVAFMTIIERKQLAAHQRRVGPNTVGYFGVLQPFSDALKLIIKEPVIPSQSNKVLFYLAPVITLFFSLLGWKKEKPGLIYKFLYMFKPKNLFFK